MTWLDWLATLSPAERDEATALRDRFAAFGDADPEGSAQYELTENVPHLSGFRVLRRAWEIIDSWGPSNGQTSERGAEAGNRLAALANPEDLPAFARMVAYDTMHRFLQFLDDPTGEPDVPGATGWAFVEATADFELTGRRMKGLHESLGPDRRTAESAWARSELTEDIPQLSRFRLLSGVWDIIDRAGPPGHASEEAEKRLAASGAKPEDLQAFARMASYDTMHSFLYFIDDPLIYQPEVPGATEWALIETRDDQLTGRLVQGLYQDMDPER